MMKLSSQREAYLWNDIRHTLNRLAGYHAPDMSPERDICIPNEDLAAAARLADILKDIEFEP